MLIRTGYRISLALTALVALTATSPASALTFTPLGDLVAGAVPDSTAYGISADGLVVVGTGNDALDTQAFRWTAGGGMVGLGDLPGGTDASFGYATDADGSRVVGQGSGIDISTNPTLEAFTWDTPTGPMTGIGHHTGSTSPLNSVARGVSDNGLVVVGESSSSNGLDQAFIWDGSMRVLDPISGHTASTGAYGVSASGDVIVGIAAKNGGPNDSAAVMWTNEGTPLELGSLAGGVNYSIALGVSADGGTAVGMASSSASHATGSGNREAFYWTLALGISALGDLAGGVFDSVANAASADGSVIVGRGSTVSGASGFIWTASAGMLDLNVIAMSVLGDYHFQEAFDISDDGLSIVGRCTDSSGNNEACLLTLDSAPVPEPGTALLLALGLLGLGARRSATSR